MIKISVLYPDSRAEGLEFTKDKIIVGTGKLCEVRLKHEEISREHLCISKKENKITVRDISMDNWTVCDGQRLPKSIDIDYVRGKEIMLPGKIKMIIA